MKKLILMTFILLLAACGKEDGAGACADISGSWGMNTETYQESHQISASCEIRIPACSSVTYIAGTDLITTESSEVSGCPSIGSVNGSVSLGTEGLLEYRAENSSVILRRE